MPEPTVEQLMNMDKVPLRKPSAIVPIIAFLFLPPLGVYLLWKEKSFHRVFALLSLIFGIANTFSALSIYLAVIPKLGELYSELNLPDQTNPAYIIIYGVLSIGQVIVSFYFLSEAKKKSFLETWELATLAILTLLVDFVVLPLIIGTFVVNMILPIYQHNLDPYNSLPTN